TGNPNFGSMRGGVALGACVLVVRRTGARASVVGGEGERRGANGSLRGGASESAGCVGGVSPVAARSPEGTPAALATGAAAPCEPRPSRDCHANQPAASAAKNVIVQAVPRPRGGRTGRGGPTAATAAVSSMRGSTATAKRTLASSRGFDSTRPPRTPE